MSKVKDYMQSPVYVIEKEEPVQRARNLMLKHYISRLLVMDGEKLAGIVTKHDISHRLSQAAPEWRRRPISKVPVKLVMTDRPITIYPGATVEQAAEIMDENGIDGLPVERDEGEIVGIITSRDLISYFVEKKPDSKVGDLMNPSVVTVHRHHTIDHVLEEMVENGVDRVVVCEDNATPVGVITHTNLAISGLSDSKDELKTKSIKMARKESTAGRKEYRYVKEVPLVAEDVMSYPIIFTGPDVKAVDAAKILLDKEICGLPVVDDGRVVGFFSTRDITTEVARWS
ncbi:MAG: CBS domain-containing protein [Methanothrix sp.]|jgi:CBS domain-containing protein|nr:CBS domain-containing protein [Methanothrix sp.]OPX81731.1 MAG: Inosine-5'-monophosphate dehydrogenase [Methanosaeta sp. PtaB.Bin087]OPY55143.1 MAG: Inosine-5'-monophosphate dehydrogenase [Methanosaeta sp. PtaU1.Bin055]NLX40229.1 CBS domain-containing protein [Methanothrix sp.]HNR57824.1 CBS domain-containing protein [Methanothrix sp.]